MNRVNSPQWLCHDDSTINIVLDIIIIITRHSLVRAGRCISFTVCFFFVFLFGQRFLDNPQADSRQSSHAGVLWFRMCLLPFWGLAFLGAEKGAMKFSLLWESMGNFAFWCFLSDISATRARIHTKFYLCRDNVCLRTPSPCGVHRPLEAEEGELKTPKIGGGLIRA